MLTISGKRHSGYCDGVHEAGGTPFILPPNPREEDLEEFVDRIDGLLMTGGGVAASEPTDAGAPAARA